MDRIKGITPPGENPVPDPGPGSNPGFSHDTGYDSGPGHNPGHDPGHDPGHGPNPDSNPNPDSGYDSGPGHNPGPDPNSNPDSGPGFRPKVKGKLSTGFRYNAIGKLSTVFQNKATENRSKAFQSSPSENQTPYKSKRVAGRIIVATFSMIMVAAASLLLLKISEKKRVIDGRNLFSSLEISLSGNQTYTISGAGRENPFIIMFFSADCHYCHLEIQALLENISAFADTDIYMVTTNYPETIFEFENLYSLEDYPRITAGRVSEEIFSAGYGIMTVPSILIYDETGQLLYSNSGYTPVDKILEVLEI